LSRAFLLLLAFAAGSPALAAQSLLPRVEGNQLRVTAPRLTFLTGEPLERLQNGASVTYQFELTIREGPSGRTLGRARERFTVSYDLWEERFAITRLGPSTRSVSHLSAAAAEVWFLNNLILTTTRVMPDQSFWIRLEFRAEDPADSASSTDDTGMTLGGLVDIFSRRGPDRRLRGYIEEGPFRLADLRKNRSR